MSKRKLASEPEWNPKKFLFLLIRSKKEILKVWPIPFKYSINKEVIDVVLYQKRG